MRREFSFPRVALLAVLLSISSSTGAQEEGKLSTASLAYSRDGRLLREIQIVSPAVLGEFTHVRAITYDARTCSISNLLDLGPDTWFLSATSDGRTAIISVHRFREDVSAYLLLVDMETGQTQDIPREWFDAEDQNPYAQISANGQLVSAFTQSGPQDSPLVVTIYNWRTKKSVGKHSEGYHAGGVSWGGVTVDGKIEFLNNRVGGDIADRRTGRLLAKVGPNFYRSLDGAWVVEFPNPMYEYERLEVIIKNGRNGELAGKLDLPIEEDKSAGMWAWARAAFCGTSGRFVAATYETVDAFEIPTGRRIANFPAATWEDADAMKTDPTVTVGCSLDGKRVAIRSGNRLTLHDLK